MKNVLSKILFFISLILLTLCLGVGHCAFAQKSINDGKTNVINTEKYITIFPMPVDHTVRIRLSPALQNEVSRVEIVNIIGRTVVEQNIIDKNTIDLTFNNLSQLPQGVYMIVTKDKFGKVVQSAKMIISR